MYQVPDMNVWRGRVNPNPDDLLNHQVIQPLDMTAHLFSPVADRSFAFLGFGCDEGVRRNFGRMGARNAPDQIRKIIAGLAFHLDPNKVGLVDAGNVLCMGQNLESGQTMLGDKVAALLTEGYFPVVLGGGQETSYGHFQGIYKHFGEAAKIGVINLDAHFDVRTYEQGSHSGSSFRQISELEGSNFYYMPIGIRPESNIRSLFEFMDQHGQEYFLLSDVLNEFQKVQEAINDFVSKVDHVYLTIDMDCFPAAYAPGVSAAAPSGIFPNHAIQVIKQLKSSDRLRTVDLVEVNPEYDIDNRTSKLAAELIYHVLHS
jgi:formiminoglutamase